MKRGAGILLNVSMMPSQYGIGQFDDSLIEFSAKMSANGFKWWQVLPMTTINASNSPYSGYSAFAGNYLYISPELMVKDGFLTENEKLSLGTIDSPYKVDYNAARELKKRMLDIAYAKIGDYSALEEFEHKNPWVADYAVFMSVKTELDNAAWWNWTPAFKNHVDEILDRYKLSRTREYFYYVFEQYVWQKQWLYIKRGINANGVKIIGDMPLYVDRDSVDVWANRAQFKLNRKGAPTAVAGVPPDYFSEEGQLWGNPVFDDGVMRGTNYKWFVNRFDRMFEIYDCLRIDHFRAFDRYWEVKADAASAKEGKWRKGLGLKLFETYIKHNPSAEIIAEDLGIIDDGVRTLLKKTCFPGMRVLQFAFSDGESTHLPHNYDSEVIGYTGTHDNDTTLSYVAKLEPNIRDYMLRYLNAENIDYTVGGPESPVIKAMFSALIKSSCKLAVIPYQDLVGWGGDTRTNVPGVAEGNWQVRATDESTAGINWKYYLSLINLYGRNGKC